MLADWLLAEVLFADRADSVKNADSKSHSVCGCVLLVHPCRVGV